MSLILNIDLKEFEHVDLEETDAGFYSGLIESLFSLTQAIVMIHWGRAADRIGRKPFTVVSLFSVTLATGLWICKDDFTDDSVPMHC